MKKYEILYKRVPASKYVSQTGRNATGELQTIQVEAGNKAGAIKKVQEAQKNNFMGLAIRIISTIELETE